MVKPVLTQGYTVFPGVYLTIWNNVLKKTRPSVLGIPPVSSRWKLCLKVMASWPMYLKSYFEGWHWSGHVIGQNVHFHEMHVHAYIKFQLLLVLHLCPFDLWPWLMTLTCHTPKYAASWDSHACQILSLYLFWFKNYGHLTFDLEGWPWQGTPQNMRLREIVMHANIC